MVVITAIIVIVAIQAIIAILAIRATIVIIVIQVIVVIQAIRAIIVITITIIITTTITISITLIILTISIMSLINIIPLMIGGTEIFIIAGIVLLLFGGKKIPELMRSMGQGVRYFKKGVNEDLPEDKTSRSELEVQLPVEDNKQ